MFELRDLERFITIAEHRNFGRAAVALGMTQPALSRRIALLERELGAAVFSRARRQIELTAVGQLVVREGRTLLAAASLAERAIREAARGRAGHLRIGTRSTMRYRLIPEALRRLRESHPHISVSVVDPAIETQLELLRAGTIDVTVVRGPFHRGDDLRGEVLRSDPVVVALPRGHRLAERDVVEVEELAREPFVEVAEYRSYGYRDVVRGVAAAAGFVPRVTQTLDTFETLLTYVAAEVGIALMHDASGDLPLPDVVYRPLQPAGPAVELHAVRRAADRNPAIDPLVAHLTAAANEPAM